MAERVFNFISPGVEVVEIDNTGRPDRGVAVGPVIVGRAERGPGLVPVQVEDYRQFIEFFGTPHPGGQGGDLWREGNKSTPLYGAYAARAFLRNSTPLTYVRLLGATHSDATAAGEAGWETQNSAGSATGLGDTQEDGGAYGLFIFNSGAATDYVSGTLAAIWYVNQGSVALSGTLRGYTGVSAPAVTGTAVVVESIGENKEFKAIIRDGNDVVIKETAFNFNENSRRYIRKVFNTNPTLTNAAITDAANLENYWLGETFEAHLDSVVTSSAAGSQHAVILGLRGPDAAQEGSDFRLSTRPAQTGWFFGQDLQIVSGSANSFDAQNMPKLFKLHGRNSGEWANRGIKVSIEDIRPSTSQQNPFGSFSVVIRRASDRDTSREIIERFTECNLNPSSQNFIGRKIGDKYAVWDDIEREYTIYGNYDNRSRFVRVEVDSAVEDAAVDAQLLPFGCYGPVRHKRFTLVSGSTSPSPFNDVSDPSAAFTGSFVKGAEFPIVQRNITENDQGFVLDVGNIQFSGNVVFPATSLRESTQDGNLSSPREAYFGLQTDKSAGTKFDMGFADYTRPLPSGYSTFAVDPDITEYSWVFTLDDVSGSGDVHAVYNSGSRAAGTSFTAVFGDYRKVITEGYDRFTVPLFGGFDGLDVTERDPFRNTFLEGGTETTNYAFNSIKRSIDAVSDSEEVEHDLISVPGVTNEALTSQVLNVAASRRDTFGIIDLKGDYVPSHENTSSEGSRLGSVRTTIDNLDARGIDNEYGACYYPWLRYRDEELGSEFWGPPSIAAIGCYGFTEGREEIFFAPAGSRRGGLSEGAAGIPVVGTRERLRKRDRDELYEARINPIGKFTGGNIQVYGQKTLLGDQTKANSRVNVKRLTNYIKRNITRISSRFLFEPNLPRVWNRLRGAVKIFMRDVRARLGISDFKFELSSDTTTPELVDRNILYAKLFIKPAQAIEFVRIDMNISNSGVSFDD